MNKSATPRQIYADRIEDLNRRLAVSTRSRDRIGNLRLLVFLAGAAVVWYIFHGVAIWWILIPSAVFIALMWQQARFEREAECLRRAIQFYDRGLARLEGRWQGNGEDGSRFIDPHHPYATDLDLFGHGSLFELLSTARTRGGEERLAGWLKSAAAHSAGTEELLARHQAIDELRPMLDLRERIAVLGDDYRTGVNPDALIGWSAQPAEPFTKSRRITAFILAIAALAMLIGWAVTEFQKVSPRVGVSVTLSLVGIALIEGAFAFSIRKKILRITLAVEEPARDLDLLSQILATLERQQFRSPLLIKLRKGIEVKGHPASYRIALLRRWMEMLDSRDNLLLRIFGPLLLWNTQVSMGIEQWKAENGAFVAQWLDAVSEIEALTSLGNYAWEHPEDPFPEFAAPSVGPIFDGEALCHPLLPTFPENKCVPNSVALNPPLCLLVVSGSNMSGKSTLLRTIGINAVLALAGAPVRAKSLRLSHLSLGASIRTLDSLEEGHSRFMAEILRLKQILELPVPTLFLLDELLGGTNSHDRALGSEGLIRALLARGDIGLLTTHDLSLSRVADDLAPAAGNVHFEDRLENGRLIFDYRMRPGVVQRSNAIDLMRAVGLDV
jgi:hypothetical protein